MDIINIINILPCAYFIPNSLFFAKTSLTVQVYTLAVPLISVITMSEYLEYLIMEPDER